ncbi:hypothetical protein Fmac_025002 [Flemingia macrophylla]|uniref:Uncharacterized protein n=1 Tax=Flemingia macrophylla TaxID=520843 RepID=A0ABD1LQZ4_9FABA
MERQVHEQLWHASIFLSGPLQPSSWRSNRARPFSLSCTPRWDSNAEAFRHSNAARHNQQHGFRNKRRWWSDENHNTPFEEEEQASSGIWGPGIDSIWIVEIFKSYGWTLPVILASWLLANGPKAFLMALVLPLGQSALALAFEKLWGQPESKPKRKHRMRRKPRRGNSSRVEEESEEDQKTRKGYQSWVVENNGSVDKGGREEVPASFGGWDDLERSRPARKSSRAMNGSQRKAMEGGRLSRREKKSDTPLLLRLLIAIFPFLGTWTKML